MTPYYASPDGSIQVYHARWEDVRDAGLLVGVSFVWADPPYGPGQKLWKNRAGAEGTRHKYGALGAKNRLHLPVHGDGEPFDPAPLVSLGLPTVLWGANYYADRLEPSPSYLFWDKREGRASDTNADGELAWTNLGGPLRTFGHWWRGALTKSERGHRRLHPTQKPEALCYWGFEHAMKRGKLKRGDTVLVPYMGSGPELNPARALGLRVIACDVEELYCRTAVNARLQEEPRTAPVGPLFGGV